MSGEYVPVVAAILGAVVGSVSTYLLSRSRLDIVIDRISIVPSRHATTNPVQIDSELRQAITDFPVPLPGIAGVTTPERTYVTWLEIVRQLTDDISLRLDLTAATCDKFRRFAIDADFARLIEAYKHDQADIWAWGEGEVRRGNDIFSNPAPDYSSLTRYYPLYFDDEHEKVSAHIVDVEGIVDIYFDVEKRQVAHSRARALEAAERLAKAFAFHVQSDLVDYFTVVRESASAQLALLRDIQDRMKVALRDLARLEIEFLVSNSGRSGVSIGADARAVLALRGYAASDENQQLIRLIEDVRVRLGVVSEQRIEVLRQSAKMASGADLRIDDLSPIVLQAGQTIRLVATSEHLVDEYPAASAIRAAYAGAERTIILELAKFARPTYRFGRKDRTLKLEVSRPVLFRDLRL